MRASNDQASAGIALMVVAMLIAPFMDMFSKLLTETVSPGQTTLGRFVVQSALLLPLVLMTGQWGPIGRLHVIAGALLGIALIAINVALQVMPVANALAVFFVEPLFLTLLSALLLGERLGWRRLTAVGIGLVGTLVVLNPNVAAFGIEAAAPLITAICFAGYMVATRVMTQRGGRLAMQFWTGVVAMGVVGLASLLGTGAGIGFLALGPMGWYEAGLMLATGLVACVSHQLIAHALARAEAGVLAPLQYLEIVSAVGIGWVVFGDFPDATTWQGTAIIIGAGLYVIQRERALARRNRALEPKPPESAV